MRRSWWLLHSTIISPHSASFKMTTGKKNASLAQNIRESCVAELLVRFSEMKNWDCGVINSAAALISSAAFPVLFGVFHFNVRSWERVQEIKYRLQASRKRACVRKSAFVLHLYQTVPERSASLCQGQLYNYKRRQKTKRFNEQNNSLLSKMSNVFPLTHRSACTGAWSR